MKQPRPKKVMLITGGASGIGAATAARAAASGYRVAIADIDLATAKTAAAALGDAAEAFHLDICRPEMWEAALDAVQAKWGRLDVLINNAAIVHPGYARNVPIEDHRRTMDTNFMGPAIGTLKALGRFKAQGFGQIVTVCSMTAFLPFPGLASYAAAKHALRAFHHAVALEERDGPVAFTIVHPGATETPMLAREAEVDEASLAFAGPAMAPSEVAAIILKAQKARSVEVCIPPARGRVVRRVGTNPKLLREMVEQRDAIGRQRLTERRLQPQTTHPQGQPNPGPHRSETAEGASDEAS